MLMLAAAMVLGACNDSEGDPDLGTGADAGPPDIERTDGGAGQDMEPTDMGPEVNEWVQLYAVPGRSTCGVKSNGDIQCWGREYEPTDDFPVALLLGGPPPESPAFGLPFVQVSGRAGMLCGLTRSDRLHCWGNAPYFLPPVGEVVDLVPDVEDEPAIAFTASSRSVCWLRENRRGSCQTRPSLNEIGLSEVMIPPDIEFSEIHLGQEFGCGLEHGTGRIVCWGADLFNVAGFEPEGEFVDLASGLTHACAVDTAQRLVCWGAADVAASEERPREPVTAVASGASETGTCARLASNGHWVCWNSGQSTVERLLNENTPARGDLVDLTVGTLHACGRAPEGWLCWGSNDEGQLDIPDPNEAP